MNKAQIFKNLHSAPRKLLILPNIWDAGGARIVESIGAKAVATTSAGVAWSKGYRDGNQLPIRLLASLAEEIVNAVKVPVTIDFEAGYATDPSKVAKNLKPLIAAGISGINIEDGTDSPDVLARKIEAIKKLGSDIFINTRTDVYLQDLVPDEKKVKETLDRAALYQSAGADGLFVPGLVDADHIAKITRGTELPVNLMASTELPSADRLAKLNVRRLSSGIAMAPIGYGHIARLAASFLKEGDSRVFDEDGMGYSQLQKLFSNHA